MANEGGRPRIIESPERMDELVDGYQAKCQEEDAPITLTGLIHHLGLSSRQSLDDYATYDGFSDSVKRAKLLVEMAYEHRLIAGGQAAGPIFALKNMGWSDRQEVDHSSIDGSMTPQVQVYVPDNGRDG